ncbi:MAG TPA: DUF2339 domain-containing protein, partial [Planctomycetota bacterium]|nr:DUF2339 domain-containing protein [Planctomycetota bacterium]
MPGAAMEILVVLVILGFIFFGPMTIALIAMSQVRGLRRRVEDAERSFEVRSRRLADRFEALGVYPVPAAPPPAPPPPPMPAIPKPEPAPVRPALLPVRTAPVPVPPVRPAPVMSRPAVVAPVPAMAVAPASPKEEVPLENMIGERVLPRIGVIAIVFGLALLVWYAWGQFGKEGKIALTASTGAAMVVGGVLLRRNAYTQLLGSCLIGGGWAVLYITAYASHSIQASRIIASPVLGFVLLMAVAEAALIHALRYRSETIAGIAYLLTIATLLISPAPLGAAAAWCAIGLSGAVVLALALKEKWIRLCVVGAKLLYIAEAV